MLSASSLFMYGLTPSRPDGARVVGLHASPQFSRSCLDRVPAYMAMLLLKVRYRRGRVVVSLGQGEGDLGAWALVQIGRR